MFIYSRSFLVYVSAPLHPQKSKQPSVGRWDDGGGVDSDVIYTCPRFTKAGGIGNDYR